jgi:hypothetical protein
MRKRNEDGGEMGETPVSAAGRGTAVFLRVLVSIPRWELLTVIDCNILYVMTTHADGDGERTAWCDTSGSGP